MMYRIVMALFLFCSLASLSRAADAPMKAQWKVDSDARSALIFAPASAKTKPAPLVFVYHGHRGTAEKAATTYDLQKYWPEAIVVYPQGLNTASRVDPEGKETGWAVKVEGNRDLKMFDVMLAGLEKDYKVDKGQVFVAGHSNGAGFAYTLWQARGDVFAAFAPSSSGTLGLDHIKPKPVMHIAGETDPIVKFEAQKHVMETLRKVNGCDPEGKTWAPNATLYASKTGTPVITYIHPGQHAFPADVPALIVKFFKEQGAKADSAH